MTFTPVLFSKAGYESVVAYTAAEAVELQWDGWIVGEPWTPDANNQHITVGTLNDRLSTTIARMAVGGDETAALNTYLASASPLGIKQLVGSFTVSGTLVVPAGLYVDLTRATITQTASNIHTLSPGAGATIMGGKFVGKGTDYVSGASVVPTAIGAKVTATGVSFSRTRFENHAGAGVYGYNAVDLSLDGVRVAGLGSPTIPAGDGACFGTYLASGCSRVSISDFDTWDVSIGLIGSVDTDYLSLSKIRVRDIHGQHGVYLQNGTGLNIDGVLAVNTFYNGVKVQLSTLSTADSLGMTISNIVGYDCSDNVLSINNTAADLTSAKKFRGVTINGVSGDACGRVLYLASVHGGMVSNIVARNCATDAFTFLDLQDVQVSNIGSIGSGRLGVRCTTVTGSKSERVTFRGVRIRNPAVNDDVNNVYAWQVNGVTGSDWVDLTIDGLDISSTNANMDYGFFFASGDQETLTMRNARIVGSTSNDVRLASGPRAVKEWTNVRLGPLGALFFPMTALPIGGTGLANVHWGNAAPTTGTWKRGDIVLDNAPAASGFIGRVCTAAGTPGTWKTFGVISA